MNFENNKYFIDINQLIENAFEVNSFGAFCSLLRVSGLEDAHWDPFEESRNAFDDYNWILSQSKNSESKYCVVRIGLLMYCQLIELTAPHEILANLLRCSAGKSYVCNPFEQITRKKGFLDVIPPSAKSKINYIIELSQKGKKNKVKEIFESFFDDNVRNSFIHSDYILIGDSYRYKKGNLGASVDLEHLRNIISNCFDFYSCFINVHKLWLKNMSNFKKYHKWGNYEVMEILSEQTNGAYGFRMHFSNGSDALYTRTENGIEACNIFFEKDGTVNFFVGDLNQLEKKWKVNGKEVKDWGKLE